MTEQTSAFEHIREGLATRGVMLEIRGGQYCVAPKNTIYEAEFFADDLEAATRRGIELAEQHRDDPPPLGPLGRRSRKGAIYRHNWQLIRRRRKRGDNV